VGAVNGGDWPSTVAGKCVTSYRIALFPGESCQALQDKINECVAQAAANDRWLRDSPPSVEYVGFQAEGCECDIDGEFGRTLRDAHHQWNGRPPDELKATCTTDVRFFSLYERTPATCYGPKARNIHGVDEKVSIDSMERVAAVLTSFIRDWCGLREA
jgi:acetylornithine deacetylase